MGTVFRNALLVQLDPPDVRPGAVRQDRGRIVAVGADVAAEPDDDQLDCGGAVLMPGLVNGHTHLYSSLAAGMPAPPEPPKDFHEILRHVWWRLDRAHTHASIELSGRVGALAALRCGTTTLIDHHASPSAIDGSFSALEQGIAAVGCRAVLCYETTDRNRPDEARQGLAENQRYVAACQQRAEGRFAGMIGAHASFTLGEATLSACVDLARQLEVGVHLHVAEDPIDQQLTQRSFGCDLIERFGRHGLLDLPGTIFAHGTHLSQRDIGLLHAHRATITMAHNPRSNMNNGVGYATVGRFGMPVMLGTDGIGADMWNEARTAVFKSHDARCPLKRDETLRMLSEAARVASACLGIELGRLAVGAAADLLLTDYRPATPMTASNLAMHFSFAMGPEYVRHVMIDGRWCLRDRQAVNCDATQVHALAAEQAASLYRRMAEIPCP